MSTGVVIAGGDTRTKWVEWPVNWSAVWVGALAAVAAVLVFGLIGAAIGAQVQVADADGRIVDLRKIGLGALAFAVFSAFLAFVIAGWAAGKVAGIEHAEPAMLHGAISWLTALPLLVVLAGLGAGSYLGAWYGGAAGRPVWASAAEVPGRPDVLDPAASESDREAYRREMEAYRTKAKSWREDAPRAARNAALGTLTALLLGLMGSVVGGWMASGEPMTPTYRRSSLPAPGQPERI